jgi:aspartate carbamoyltransferase catalytic subunit
MQNIKIGMVGDLLNGRTVHSLAYMLSMFEGVKMYFVAPKVSMNFTTSALFTV